MCIELKAFVATVLTQPRAINVNQLLRKLKVVLWPNG